MFFWVRLAFMSFNIEMSISTLCESLDINAQGKTKTNINLSKPINPKMTVPTTPSTDLTTESTRSIYDQLSARLKDISHLQGIARLLGWDQLVMMPKKAEDARADQVQCYFS